MADRDARKAKQRSELAARDAQRRLKKALRKALDTADEQRSKEDAELLRTHAEQVAQMMRAKRRYSESQARQAEVCDSPEALEVKVKGLAALLSSANHVVAYTGAGISTAAGIPDYRGPKGIWTQLKEGVPRNAVSQPATAIHDLVPTATHMLLADWVRRGLVKHVVSQNCDGLHLRSGIPPQRLSEIHGNCLVEVCLACEAKRRGSGVVWRDFDVSCGTALRRHATGRHCPRCNAALEDTIVHFGEKNRCTSVHEWPSAFDHAARADLILCLGSSLKILKAYRELWVAVHGSQRRAKLVIVNLQWTPKDAVAALKIQAPVDDVLPKVHARLASSAADQTATRPYAREADPFFQAALPRDERCGSAEGGGRNWFGQGLKAPTAKRQKASRPHALPAVKAEPAAPPECAPPPPATDKT